MIENPLCEISCSILFAKMMSSRTFLSRISNTILDIDLSDVVVSGYVNRSAITLKVYSGDSITVRWYSIIWGGKI